MNTVEEIAANLSAEQKHNLEEVATLMLEIFRTLQRMAYLDEDWIQPGPHNDAINALMPHYQSLNIDPAIIYLYSILPYIDPDVRHRVDFYDGGTFVDFRDKNHVNDGRDPFYTYNDEMKTPPFMTPLSQTGNHTNMLMYDAKRNRIGIYDFVCGGLPGVTGDSNIEVGACYSTTREDGSPRWFRKGLDGVEGDFETEEEFLRIREEWWARMRAEREEEGAGEYQYNFEEMMVNGSRSAPDVLRDVNRWYIELTNAPGAKGSNSVQCWDAEVTKRLYRKHGWPGEDFDREAFLVDHLRVDCLERARRNAEEGLRRLGTKPESNQASQDALTAKFESAKAAGDVDEECALRWELWWNDQQYQSLKAAYEETEETAKRMCPTGEAIKPSELPLWELRQVQLEMYEAQQRIRDLQSHERPVIYTGYSRARLEEELRYKRRTLALLEKAVVACEADVARLCPGKTPFPLDDVDKNGRPRARGDCWSLAIEKYEKTDAAVREWMGQLPEGAERARNLAQAELEQTQKQIENNLMWRNGSRKALEEMKVYED